jgi:hypothetical protein
MSSCIKNEGAFYMFNNPIVIVILFVVAACVFFFVKPKLKAFIGEKTIVAFLSRLDREKYIVMNDLVVWYNGKTFQINQVIVSNYGVFVIETKNYKGLIYGSDYGQFWTQVLKKTKHRFYNPVNQNDEHIRALEYILSEFGPINYIPIIVFPINSKLKVKVKAEVIYSVNLLKTMAKYKEETISNTTKEKICYKLERVDKNNKGTKRNHVKHIHVN